VGPILDRAGIVSLLDPLNRLLSARGRRARRVWSAAGHVHIELRKVDSSQVDRFCERLEADLTDHRAVRWVETVGEVGRVVVAFDEGAAEEEDFVECVESVEEEFGVQEEPFAGEAGPHPADVEPIVRGAVEIAGSTVGLGLATAQRAARLPPIPYMGTAAGGLAFLEHQPRVRRLIEHVMGTTPAELMLSLTNGVAQGLAGSPIGPMVDIGHRATLLAEAAARRRRWLDREAALWDGPSGHPKGPAVIEPRSVPLPPGPVEKYADRALLLSLGGSALAVATTRSLQRSSAMLQAGLPKAAHLGREGFAAHLGRVLAARGILPLDSRSLRLLDRVDCVVLDIDLLVRDEFELTTVTAVGSDDQDDPERVARRLFDRRHPAARRRRGQWTLAPLEVLGLEAPPGSKRLAGRMAKRGVALGLSHRGRLVALAGAEPAPRAGSADLVTAGRSAGLQVVVAADDPGRAARLHPDRVAPGGSRLPRAIRSLQRAGRVVLLVASGGSPGLPVADVALGLRLQDGPPPWAADLLSEDDDLSHAYLLVQACATARQASRQSVALSGLGAGAAAVTGSLGLALGADQRTMNTVNLASAAALANGTRIAMGLARRPRPAWREAVPWHELDASEALARLGTSPAGLSEEQATLRRPPDIRSPSGALLLARSVTAELLNPLSPILAAGAGLAATVGSVTDAALIGGTMFLNALVGGVERYRAERAIERLEGRSTRGVLVTRAGEERVIDADGLVPGDVVRLRAGESVPADCRILEACSLEVDESSLTGESLPVPKAALPSFAAAIAERTSMLYEGTAVAAGEATAVVVATGPETETRQGDHLQQIEPPRSGVEARLESLTSLAGPVALGSGGLLAGVAALRGLPVREVVDSGVALATAAVPEGLPLLATIAQLTAARRLADQGALVRSRRAVEALGRVDIACVDKTGTLTEGRIALVAVSDGTTETPVNGRDLTPRARGILAAGLRAAPDEATEGLVHAEDRALVEGAGTAEVAPDQGAPDWRQVTELPFEPGRGFHAVLGNNHKTALLAVKGAPEVVLTRASTSRDGTGPVRLTAARRRRLMAEARRLARRGLRVLAVAERAVPAGAPLDEGLVDDLTFLGFLAYSDPIRATAAEAVRNLRRAGVDIVMITGDHPNTAESIATELDLVNGKRIMTGPELDALGDDELAAVVPQVAVFARVTPRHKVRVVRALQHAGRVVAMTGDGANDAQAIRLADVGIAFGKRSTPATRAAADLLVTDNRIETIVAALLEGRALWASTREAAAILVGGNLGEIAFTVAGAAATGRPPLNARQLLLVNLLTDAAPAMAIAVRQPTRPSPEQLLREGPEASLGGALIRDIAWRATMTGAGAAGAWLAARATGSKAHASTVAMTTLVGAQLGQTLLVGWRDPVVLATGLGSATLLAGIVQTPGLSHFFGCRPLGPLGWTISAAASGAATAGSLLIPTLGRLLSDGGDADDGKLAGNAAGPAPSWSGLVAGSQHPRITKAADEPAD
jgi:cation-transporting P-type ATPase I